MVENYADQIAPVNHSGLSATTNVAAGAGVGAVKGGFSWGGKWIGVLAGVGAGIGLISTLPFTLPAFVGAMFTGALVGGGVGLVTSPVAGGLGAVFGGLGGGAKAANQVKQEKGAAVAMNAQLEAYKYNAMAQAAAASQGTVVNAPSATNIIPQGSAMNMASPQIDTSGLQYDGPVTSQQLAAAR